MKLVSLSSNYNCGICVAFCGSLVMMHGRNARRDLV